MRILACLTVLAVSVPATARTMATPPSVGCLAKPFVGGQRGATLEYFRLELASDGTGVLIAQYLPQNAPVAYQITRTEISGYKVKFHVAPIDRNAEPIYLRGEAICSRLDLTVGGAAQLKWKRELVLEPLERVMSRIEAVNERAARLKARSN